MRKILFILALFLVNSFANAQLPSVLICGATPTSVSFLTDVRSKLIGTGLLGTVDTFNVYTGTPTLTQLQAYQAVLLFRDAGYINSSTLGDNLAAYINGGGGVVTAVFNTQGGPTGNFSAAAYQVTTTTSSSILNGQASLGTVNLPSHPVMQGVTTFSGGTSSFREGNATLVSGAFMIAQWNDGKYLVAGRTGVGTLGVNRAELNFYPPSSGARGDFWTASTDGAKLMANALRWVSNSVTIGTLSSSPLYPGSAITVPFTASGVFNSGNVFTAQLSDASGSFAAPVNIGTLTATASGSISATIPLSTTPGSAYRIRVNASNPGTTGSDNGTNLTIQPPPNALSFDGVDDYISLGTSALLRPTAAFTLSTWAYRPSWSGTQADQAMVGNTEGGGYELYYKGSTGEVAAWARRNGGYGVASASVTGLSAGWHHFAMTYDGRYNRLYIDGTLAATNDAGGTYPQQYAYSNAFIIGAEAGQAGTPVANEYYTGNLDEVSVWSRALCQSEVQSLMSGMLNAPATQNGLIAYYSFNQGIAGGTNTGITTLADAGPNALTGSLSGFAKTGSSSNFVTSSVGTVTNPAFVMPVSTSNNASMQTVSGTTSFIANCGSIASLNPSGASPVTGSVTATVWVDGSVPSFNGAPYVARRYDLAPTANANTATATVTLYYTQAEFDAYNAAPNTPYDLPTNPGDAAGKANLRITQHHGTSSTGLPGSYTGWGGSGPARVSIDPADADIVWNSVAARWEVTFPITGFSGFFAHGTAGATPLPVKMTSFTAEQAAQGNRLDWQVAMENSISAYIVERSADGKAFSGIGQVAGSNSASYAFNDAQPFAGKNFYRLRITEADGSSTFSNTVLVNGSLRAGATTVSPVPANSRIRIACNDARALNGSAVITDMQGRLVERFRLAAEQELDIKAWPAGVYILKLSTGDIVRIVKQ